MAAWSSSHEYEAGGVGHIKEIVLLMAPRHTTTHRALTEIHSGNRADDILWISHGDPSSPSNVPQFNHLAGSDLIAPFFKAVAACSTTLGHRHVSRIGIIEGVHHPQLPLGNHFVLQLQPIPGQ